MKTVINVLIVISSGVMIFGGAVYLAACCAAFAGLFRSRRKSSGFSPTVSILIAARNEEASIGKLLEDLLAQDYPREKLKIHVIDDCSEDGTADIVRLFTTRDSRISLEATSRSESPYTHKKKAIHEGIMSSDGKIIMTVDADCRVNREWVSLMIGHFTHDIELVAGEVFVEGGRLIGWLETIEFIGIQMMSAGLMNAGFPVTCNGANLAYRRSAFERVGGYDGVGNVVSGDDDLLMQKISRGNARTVHYATGAATAVRVRAKHTAREFLVQRTRWASKIATYPSRSAVIMLSVFFVFFMLLPVWVICAFAGLIDSTPLLVGFSMKLAGDVLLCGYGVHLHGRYALLGVFPLAEILHVPYILYVTVRGYFGTFEWRGRHTVAVAPTRPKAHTETTSDSID